MCALRDSPLELEANYMSFLSPMQMEDWKSHIE